MGNLSKNIASFGLEGACILCIGGLCGFVVYYIVLLFTMSFQEELNIARGHCLFFSRLQSPCLLFANLGVGVLLLPIRAFSFRAVTPSSPEF